MKADVVILLTKSTTDSAREALEKDLQHLADAKIGHHLIECNIWDPAVVTSEVGTMVTAAPQHEYFFNTSTGPRTACIAGTVAAMLWPVRPYYVPVDADAKEVEGRDDFPVSGEAIFIPTFETPSLERSTVEALEYIATRGNPLSKKELMSHLRDVGVLKPRRGIEAVTPQAYHAQTDSILQRLVAWGFVELSGRGKTLQIRATSMGSAGSKMFHHVLNPRPPPEVLLARSSKMWTAPPIRSTAKAVRSGLQDAKRKKT
ncbi:MAG: hypothetical protein JRN35_05125 [Nitrososphaerota archaeon]|nr:hypothetical protein [Nitrososphaerota archaeon]